MYNEKNREVKRSCRRAKRRRRSPEQASPRKPTRRAPMPLDIRTGQITMAEVNRFIVKSLKNGTAPGWDKIPPEACTEGGVWFQPRSSLPSV
ncbi:hypothetical protein ACROYT_G037631 [Oculina patagonica]